MIIKVTDICKEYTMGKIKVEALNNVSFCFESGKFYALVGRSGSGKSTLLHLIGGLDAPTSGSIFFDNQDISLLKERQKANIRSNMVGCIFQAFHLESNYTCLDNVILPLIANRYPRGKRKVRAVEMLNRFGLENRIYHKPIELSGGEKQRVAIARALINDPAVILADEPTGNLDSKNGEIIMRALRDMANEGKTVILVTHNQADVCMADEIIKLKDGMIIDKEEVE